MKKKILLGVFILTLFTIKGIGQDTTVTFTKGRGDALVLSVGGYNITMNSLEKTRCHYANDKLSFGNAVEFGLNTLTGTDYKKYPAGDNNFLDLNVAKSFHFGFNILSYSTSLNHTSSLRIGTALHFMCDNYVFDNNVTLKRVDGLIVPVELEKDYKKSKLTAAYIGVPVNLTYRYRRAAITLTGYADLLINSHTKYKKPKEKEHLSGLNQFQLGFGANVTFASFGVYGKYCASPLFKNDVGPEAHLLNFGIILFL